MSVGSPFFVPGLCLFGVAAPALTVAAAGCVYEVVEGFDGLDEPGDGLWEMAGCRGQGGVGDDLRDGAEDLRCGGECFGVHGVAFR